jgi:ferredoxin-type protein NapG
MGDRDRLHSLLTRRAFFELVGKGAIVVALGGLMRFHDGKREFIRPPGALPEDDFLTHCTRCGKCIEVCRTVILPVLITESVIAAGTPKLRTTCSQCGRCQWYCPTGALGGR